MDCKVRIGISYEPKWFERRQTNGWYSAKNPPLDGDGMWLQSALIGAKKRSRRKQVVFLTTGIIAYLAFFL